MVTKVSERILLMGGPASGKTHQLLNVAQWALEQGKEVWLLDLEDKVSASVSSVFGEAIPRKLHLSVALSWEEIKETVTTWRSQVAPESWVLVDRADLAWEYVQRWYTQQKYKEELGDKMMRAAEQIKSSFMVAPRFDSGSWQVINMSYDDFFAFPILYGLRSNCVLTAGLRGSGDESNPLELFGGVGAAPRGQKNLPHQPHTVFLLQSKRVKNRNQVTYTWLFTTAKDMATREYVNESQITDLGLEYLEKYA